MTADEFIHSYLPLGDAVYRIAFYALETEDDAEDAVQDMYIKLWENRDTLDDVQNPKAYCITMMRNMCIDRIRKAGAFEVEEIKEDIAARESSESMIAAEEMRIKLGRAIETLTERQRRILQMKVFEELSYKEIAVRTGIDALTLRVTLSNARHKIKKAL